MDEQRGQVTTCQVQAVPVAAVFKPGRTRQYGSNTDEDKNGCLIDIHHKSWLTIESFLFYVAILVHQRVVLGLELLRAHYIHAGFERGVFLDWEVPVPCDLLAGTVLVG